MDFEDGELMPQVFVVEDEIPEVDLSLPPTSGQEYLRQVQMEASKCPTIVVADVQDTGKTATTWRMYTAKSLHPAPDGFAPNISWQREQIATFSDVRQKLLKYKETQRKEKKKPLRRLPLREDVDKWCSLCFGSLKTPPRSDDRNMSPSDVTPPEASPPLLSIIGFMDQPSVLSVLEYHVNWFEATGFSVHQGRWLYALMASLEKPLEAETCSLLRSLARNCANLRATLENAESSLLPQLNLLICIVSRYFDQFDLADDP
ncbi:hypothetical protein CAPTEDRAFT_222691 [Capitella teleta]|uniref:Gem-associated protein 2 n=1 Tax=Capitella teleta TaxID=283909 RepID=R7TW84_CAPTE|nr:hypothetical protein CAPTEDRAFT_222691 [Capitella teleta]|eukprot:ELT95711.1 hypothetical protein CAPTEDRAFT_222691 [Capitella teleta]